jgi:hypothetical protein
LESYREAAQIQERFLGSDDLATHDAMQKIAMLESNVIAMGVPIIIYLPPSGNVSNEIV